MSRCQLCGFNNQNAVDTCAKCGTSVGAENNQFSKGNREGNINSNASNVGPAQNDPRDLKRTQISRLNTNAGGNEDLKKTRLSTFKPDNSNNADLKKTQVYNAGKAAPIKEDNSPNTPDSDTMSPQNCMKCSYLLAEGDLECPNCGTEQTKQENPAAVITNKGKTVNIANINLDESEKVSVPEKKIIHKIQLLNREEEVQTEVEGETIEIGRDGIDKDNLTISSESHVQFECKDGQWYIKNTSTNNATFVQVNQQMPINDGDKIILGNAIMTFKDASAEEIEEETEE